MNYYVKNPYPSLHEQNRQPSKGLNIYRQPRFREIFNRQMTKWQSSVKREIYSGKKKKKKKSWVRLRVTSLWEWWTTTWKTLTLPYMTFIISTRWFSSDAYILLHYYWHNKPGHIWWSWQLHGVLTEKLTIIKSQKILHLKWVEFMPIKYD